MRMVFPEKWHSFSNVGKRFLHLKKTYRVARSIYATVPGSRKLRGFQTQYEWGDCMAGWSSGTSSAAEADFESKFLKVSGLSSEGRDLCSVGLTGESIEVGLSKGLIVGPELLCTADGTWTTGVNDAVLFGGRTLVTCC